MLQSWSLNLVTSSLLCICLMSSSPRPSSAAQIANDFLQIVCGHTFLLHSVAIAYSNGVIFKRLVVDRDTKWCTNGILPAVKQIESGGMLASVDFNMFKIGCTAARAAVRHVTGEALPDKVMLPAEVIDKSNYQAWLTPVEKRTCPQWSEVSK